MAQTTQRLANKFPIWTKLRADPSSFGQRLLEPAGQYFDYLYAELVKVRDSFSLLQAGLGVGYVHQLVLLETDEFLYETSASGLQIPNYPSQVIGDSIELIRDDTVEDLLYGPPTRLTLKETVAGFTNQLWDSEVPAVYGVMVKPNQLTVLVQDSTKYLRRTEIGLTTSGRWTVHLGGLDLNGLPVEEIVRVRDDGVYSTQHIFSELTSVISEGMDGRVLVLAANTDLPWMVDHFRFLATDEIEGPLHLVLNTGSVGLDMVSWIRYQTPALKFGVEYRRGQEIPDNIEYRLDQALLTLSGEFYQAVDIAVSPNSTKLYSIDTEGILRVYDFGVSPFGPPPVEPTKDTCIVVLPIMPYVRYGDTHALWTWFRRAQHNILRAKVWRVSPSGVMQYLQVDKTWGATSYSFKGTRTANPEKSWQDMKFYTAYNELGQWDYYCEAISEGRDEPYLSHTAVLCASIEPLAEINTEVVDPTGLFFSQDCLICVVSGTTLSCFEENRDSYVADLEQNRLILREEYEEVEVVF